MNWIAFSGTWRAFKKLKLNVVGTRVEIAISQPLYGIHPHYITPPPKLEQFLIGDINPNAGVCDDCVAFDSCEVVTRYLPPAPAEGT